jgi:beta-glucosidase
VRQSQLDDGKEPLDFAVEYQPGVGPRSDDVSGIPAAVEAAKRADVVLLAIGEDYDYTGEARSRASLELPGPQQALIDALKATGKPIVAILMTGRPLALEKALDGIPAVLCSWFLGAHSGFAIVDVLTGKANPGGRLPIGFPRTTGQVPIPYAYLPTGRPANPDLMIDSARYHDTPIGPLFPFGHGLSYTKFVYSRLGMRKLSVGPDEPVEVTLAVTNTGDVAGDEVVQLYARDPIASIERPVKELRAFVRVSLAPGATANIVFTLSPAQFAIWKAGKWLIEPGQIQLMAGSSSEDIHAMSGFTITAAGESRVPATAIATKVEVK